jgi:thioesterase domain-containing protein
VSVTEFLAELRSRDIQVGAEGEHLRCTAPAGTLTPELRDELQRRKGEILAFLRSAAELAHRPRAIVPLEPRGTRTPVFAVAGHNGDVFCYRALAQQLGDDQPFFGLEPPGLDGRSEPLTRVEDLAAYFAEQMRAFQPNGPYILAGFCAGGTVAFELARQLSRSGASVRDVALFGCPDPTWYRLPSQLGWRLRQQMARVAGHARAFTSLPWRALGGYIAERRRQRRELRAAAQAAALDPVLVRRAAVERATIAAIRRYRPAPFAGRLSLFLPSQQWLPSATPVWASLAQRTDEYVGPPGCDNDTMLREPFAAHFAALFRRCCAAQADASTGPSPRPVGGPLLATSATH